MHEVLGWASSILKRHGREGKVAEILLCHHLDVTRTALFAGMRERMPEDVLKRLKADVQAHIGGVPVQHLTGEEMFYGRSFAVNPNVLIPRPETEELVAAVLDKVGQRFPGDQLVRVVDVGTGSGAIAVTFALENHRFAVSAVDLSQGALSTARQNANGLGAGVDFFHGDLLTPLIERGMKVNVIVSNPPYIPESDFRQLDPLVKDHEPSLALTAGDDGLLVYRRLIAQLPAVIDNSALVAFEVGIGQSQDVAQLLADQFGYKAGVAIKKDINGKERIVLAEL